MFENILNIWYNLKYKSNIREGDKYMQINTKTHKRKKALTIIFALIIIAIIFVMATSFVFTSKNSTPTIFGYNIFVMDGNAMSPEIPDNCAVLSKAGELPKAGDVALCKLIYNEDSDTNNFVTVLRVVGTEEIDGKITYLMKSDINTTSEIVKVPSDQVVGKAIFSMPEFGAVISFAKSQLGILILIILPAALILISLLISALKNINEQEDETEIDIEEEDTNSVDTFENNKKQYVYEEYKETV